MGTLSDMCGFYHISLYGGKMRLAAYSSESPRVDRKFANLLTMSDSELEYAGDSGFKQACTQAAACMVKTTGVRNQRDGWQS